MPTAEHVARVLRLETDAALLSIIAHALADLLAYDLSAGEQALVMQAAQATMELKRRNHAERQTKDTPALPRQQEHCGK
jgi:hypothetical protein